MSGEEALVSVESTLERTAASFFDLLRTGELNGHMEASTASRVIASAVRARFLAARGLPDRIGKVGTPAVALDDLAAALTLGIEELTRPIDAIKHQAKTVTVGISRSDETLLDVALSRAVVDAGAPRDRLSTPRCAPSLTSTRRSTTCSVTPAIASRAWTLTAMAMPRLWSSTEAASAVTSPLVPPQPDPEGHEASVALERRLFVARGRSDDRTVVIVPGEGQRHHRTHTAPGETRRRAVARRRSRRAAGLPQPLLGGA